MNNYQNFLQTNTKTGKLFKKGFYFSKMSFFFPFDALVSQKNNISESWRELLLHFIDEK
jgi:hypothetical protein